MFLFGKNLRILNGRKKQFKRCIRKGASFCCFQFFQGSLRCHSGKGFKRRIALIFFSDISAQKTILMSLITYSSLFGSLDINNIQNNKDFKEDSVREVIIAPILYQLGYSQNNIVRSKSLQHPFLKVGSNKKIPITLIPDYSLKVEDNYAWVLDAKSPSESVTDE